MAFPLRERRRAEVTMGMRSAHAHTSLVRLPAAEVQMVLTILARGHINTAVWFKETTSLTLSSFQQMDTWEMPKTISPGVSVRARLGSARLDPAGGNAAVVMWRWSHSPSLSTRLHRARVHWYYQYLLLFCLYDVITCLDHACSINKDQNFATV